MAIETEQDMRLEIAGYYVDCLCKFHEGMLYSVSAYGSQSWRDCTDFSGNLLPFLHTNAVSDIEDRHDFNIRNVGGL